MAFKQNYGRTAIDAPRLYTLIKAKSRLQGALCMPEVRTAVVGKMYIAVLKIECSVTNRDWVGVQALAPRYAHLVGAGRYPTG